MKNLLLITIDSLRPDHLSPGYRRPTTPSIARLAERSWRFESAISTAPYTKAAFKTIFTGTYPFSFRGYDAIWGLPSLPELLARRGYITFGLPNIPILSESYGYARGFRFFLSPVRREKTDYISSFFRRLGLEDLMLALFRLMPDGGPLGPTSSPYMGADELTDRALEFLAHLPKGRPFFLWAHYMDLHYPYTYWPEFFEAVSGRRLRRASALVRLVNNRVLKSVFFGRELDEGTLGAVMELYDACLRFVDENVGRLLSFLEGRGLLDNTVVVLTADHGEEFQEHGAFGHTGKHFFTHMYQELLRVPLIIYDPGREARSVKGFVSTLDLLPTLVELLELKLDRKERRLIEGRSLVPHIEEGKAPGRPVVSEASFYNKERGTIRIPPREKRVISLIYNGWKYIWYEDPHRSAELYNLAKDPGERYNRAEEEPDVARDMREAVLRHVRYSRRTWVIFRGLRVRKKLRKSLARGRARRARA